MNKSASLIPVGIIVLLGSAFAATIMFPTSTEFPDPVGQPGTIGYVLNNKFPGGKATNSEKLDGRYASGYLQNTICTDIANPVWIGVDADGKGKCGTRTVMLAMDIGKFTEINGGVQVMKSGALPWVAADTSYTLRSGDVIRTNAGTGTVTFDDDLSILRLDSNTVVELKSGLNTAGQSVAEAILTDGSLWGRILTSTGVNLGGGGMVAGVRGTSVSIVENSGNYTLAIVDSTRTTDAAIVKNSNNTSAPSRSMKPGEYINMASGATTTPTPTASTTATLLANSSWNRDNTRKDIEYLDDKKDSLAAGDKKTKATDEYNITLPPLTNTLELTALCGTTAGTTQTFWSSLIDTVFDRCQPSGLVAFADYSKPSNNAIPSSFYTDSQSINPDSGAGNYKTNIGYEISSSQIDAHIAYPLTSLPSLAGKTITITLENPITSYATKKMVLDLGDELNYSISRTTGSNTCQYLLIPSRSCAAGEFTRSNNIITIKLPTGITINRFVVGALTDSATASYLGPINATIKSIRISQ